MRGGCFWGRRACLALSVGDRGLDASTTRTGRAYEETLMHDGTKDGRQHHTKRVSGKKCGTWVDGPAQQEEEQPDQTRAVRKGCVRVT